MCINLQLIPKDKSQHVKRRYSLNDPNDWNWSADLLANYHIVPCQNCPECIKARINEWTGRLKCECDYPPTWIDPRFIKGVTYFLTLTYNEKTYPKSREDALQSWRAFQKQFQRYYYSAVHNCTFNKSQCEPFRFFYVSEHGSVHNRIHLHALVFNIKFNRTSERIDYDAELLQMQKLVHSSWRKGFSEVTIATGEAFGYIAKYASKGIGAQNAPSLDTIKHVGDQIAKVYYDPETGEEKTFIPKTILKDEYPVIFRGSINPPIGAGFFNYQQLKRLKDNEVKFFIQNGYKKPVPRIIARGVFEKLFPFSAPLINYNGYYEIAKQYIDEVFEACKSQPKFAKFIEDRDERIRQSYANYFEKLLTYRNNKIANYVKTEERKNAKRSARRRGKSYKGAIFFSDLRE